MDDLGTKGTPKNRRWEPKFLDLVAKTGIISAAAQGAGVSRRYVYRLREEDPEFAARWEEAARIGIETLEDIAIKRAASTSDTLLIFLLKGAKPEKYRENHHVEGNLNVRSMSDSQLREAVRAILHERGSAGDIAGVLESEPDYDTDGG